MNSGSFVTTTKWVINFILPVQVVKCMQSFKRSARVVQVLEVGRWFDTEQAIHDVFHFSMVNEIGSQPVESIPPLYTSVGNRSHCKPVVHSFTSNDA